MSTTATWATFFIDIFLALVSLGVSVITGRESLQRRWVDDYQNWRAGRSVAAGRTRIAKLQAELARAPRYDTSPSRLIAFVGMNILGVLYAIFSPLSLFLTLRTLSYLQYSLTSQRYVGLTWPDCMIASVCVRQSSSMGCSALWFR